jgi:hypothetical protein
MTFHGQFWICKKFENYFFDFFLAAFFLVAFFAAFFFFAMMESPLDRL